MITQSGEELKLVGGGGFLGIKVFTVFPYAFFHSSIGKGKGALSVLFTILPFTVVFAPTGMGTSAKTINPISSSTPTGCRTAWTRRQTATV